MGESDIVAGSHGAAFVSPIGGHRADHAARGSGMIDEYVTMCDDIFAAVGRRFTAEQLAAPRRCWRAS